MSQVARSYPKSGSNVALTSRASIASTPACDRDTKEMHLTPPAITTHGQENPENIINPSTNPSITPVGSRSSREHIERPAYATRRLESYNKDLILYIDWEINDPGHPWNWSGDKKWLGLFVAVLFNSSTAMNATGYTTTEDGGTQAFGVSDTVYLMGSAAVSTDADFVIYHLQADL